MIKSLRLKRQLKEIEKLKIEAVKNQNFELAALRREKEKEILQELAQLKNRRLIGKLIKTLFFIHRREYLCGFYLQENEKDIPINVPYYVFSRELNFLFSCFFAEHPYFKSDWDEWPAEKRKMINEMTEYYFIINILDHLVSPIPYYKRKSKNVLEKLDINNVRQKNRFLDYFSLPMQRRTGFTDKELYSDKNIIVVKDANGNPIRYYEKIHYQTPFKIRVYSEVDDIVFNTPFMKINFHISSAETNKVRMPTDFCRLIFGFKKTHAPEIGVNIDYYYKWPAFILPGNWKYFETIRLLKTRLQHTFSYGHYFKTFNWQTMHMQSRIFENLINMKSHV